MPNYRQFLATKLRCKCGTLKYLSERPLMQLPAPRLPPLAQIYLLFHSPLVLQQTQNKSTKKHLLSPCGSLGFRTEVVSLIVEKEAVIS